MRTIVLLSELPAPPAYCRSQIGRHGARRQAQSNQKIEAAAAILVAYYDYHRMLVRAGSLVIGRLKPQHGCHRATSAAAKSP
jgi:hypothetical protein